MVQCSPLFCSLPHGGNCSRAGASSPIKCFTDLSQNVFKGLCSREGPGHLLAGPGAAKVSTQEEQDGL